MEKDCQTHNICRSLGADCKLHIIVNLNSLWMPPLSTFRKDHDDQLTLDADSVSRAVRHKCTNLHVQRTKS